VIAENQQPLLPPVAVRHQAEHSAASEQAECNELYLSSHLSWQLGSGNES